MKTKCQQLNPHYFQRWNFFHTIFFSTLFFQEYKHDQIQLNKKDLFVKTVVIGLYYKHLLVYLEHILLQKNKDMDVKLRLLEQKWLVSDVFCYQYHLEIFFHTSQIQSFDNEFTLCTNITIIFFVLL